MLTLVATSKRGIVRFYNSATSSLRTAGHHQRELLEDSLVNAFEFAVTNASTERYSVSAKLKSAFF